MRFLLIVCLFLGVMFDAMAQKPEDFPLISGNYQMTKTWAIDLGEQQFRRRFEEGALVIWRPGITMWINAYGYPAGESAEVFAKRTRDRSDLPPGAQVITKPTANKFAYFFKETEKDETRFSLQTFTFGQEGHLMMAIYFDREKDLDLAKKLLNGVTSTGPIIG